MIMTTTQKTLRDFVADNFNSASVFERHGLDFCCKGGVSLEEACRLKGLDAETIASELAEVSFDNSAQRYFLWEVPFLIDYIVNNHHAYIRTQTPLIAQHLERVVNAHGQRHPEVIEVRRIFAAMAQDLAQHLGKEEHMLFPFIKALTAASATGGRRPMAPFGSVAAPISMMIADHEDAGSELEQVRQLLDDYTPPDDACTTMRLLYAELEAFEQDLHIHVFLENNILFPKATRSEKELLELQAHSLV